MWGGQLILASSKLGVPYRTHRDRHAVYFATSPRVPRMVFMTRPLSSDVGWRVLIGARSSLKPVDGGIEMIPVQWTSVIIVKSVKRHIVLIPLVARALVVGLQNTSCSLAH